MRRAATVLLLVCAALTTAIAPAQAAVGQVVVFATELQPLTVYTDPDGCRTLPPAAHVLDNLTDRPIRHYAAPGCLGPYLTIQPGYGSHVQGLGGSFSAWDPVLAS